MTEWIPNSLAPPGKTPKRYSHMPEESIPPIEQFVPDLRELINHHGIEPSRLSLAIQVTASTIPAFDRHLVAVSDGKNMAKWPVPSLRALFRGQKVPPDLTRYPPEYVPLFFASEGSVANLFRQTSPRSDQEMEEIYATLRRRPDGKSLGVFHDCVWSIAAFFLGRYVVSQAEFEAIFQQLSVSTRRFALQPQSYRYAEYIDELGQR